MGQGERFTTLFAYIDCHLDGELTLQGLSAVACLSKYHFVRVFKATFGFSVFDYINALRDKRAGHKLLFRGHTKVMELALEQGYQSSEAFSRAFKQRIGQSPAQLKSTPDWHSWYQLTQRLMTMRMQTMSKMENYNVEIIEAKAIPVALLVHTGAMRLLGASIQQFIAWRKAHKLPPSKSRTFNFLYSDPTTTPDADCRFGLAAECSDKTIRLAEGMERDAIPAGMYARIVHIGADEAMQPAVNYLYGEWLAQSNWELAEFPLFLERVRFFPDVPEHQAETHIYLPLK